MKAWSMKEKDNLEIGKGQNNLNSQQLLFCGQLNLLYLKQMKKEMTKSPSIAHIYLKRQSFQSIYS